MYVAGGKIMYAFIPACGGSVSYWVKTFVVLFRLPVPDPDRHFSGKYYKVFSIPCHELLLECPLGAQWNGLDEWRRSISFSLNSFCYLFDIDFVFKQEHFTSSVYIPFSEKKLSLYYS